MASRMPLYHHLLLQDIDGLFVPSTSILAPAQFPTSSVECRAQPEDERAISCVYRNVCVDGREVEFFGAAVSANEALYTDWLKARRLHFRLLRLRFVNDSSGFGIPGEVPGRSYLVSSQGAVLVCILLEHFICRRHAHRHVPGLAFLEVLASMCRDAYTVGGVAKLPLVPRRRDCDEVDSGQAALARRTDRADCGGPAQGATHLWRRP